MQREFINVAAHELRTPIQPILRLSEILRSKILDEQQHSLVDVISRNAKRLQSLTEEILDVTRIESHSLRLKKEELNLKDVIVNCINDLPMNRDYSNNRGNDYVKISYELRDILYKQTKVGFASYFQPAT